MCGICGFNWEDTLLVKKMCKVIKHRGPDDSGTYTDKHVSLGHQRLSIIDLSEKGRQPIHNEDNSIWITFNGEIYNYKELRSILEKKHKFYSGTDTEVLIHAYEEWGYDCVKKLNGMFAFAIWDTNKKELFLARDRLGIKPLFYYYDGTKFIFSSEMKAIIQHNIKKSLNRSTLNQFLIHSYAVNNETLMHNVFDLLPATYLILKDSKIETKTYWELGLGKEEKSLNIYVQGVRKRLFDSVSRRLMSDVPLGASLSGGLDSSAVVAIMSKLKRDPVKTFTIGFGDPTDEYNQAKLVAEHCSTDHTEILIGFDKVSSTFPKIVWHMEAPFGRPATLPTYFLAKKTKGKVTVSLVGEGSDEIFAGYNRYYPYTKPPGFSLKYLFNRESMLFYKGFSKYKNMSRLERINSVCSGYFREENERKKAFSDGILSHANPNLDPEHVFGPYFDNSPKGEGINSALLYEIKTELTGVQLNRVDRNSMAHAVEMRVPFLDHELVEFAMSVPSKYKWHGVDKKFVLQKAVKDLLPKEIVMRRKLPFNVPLETYAKESFVNVAESVLLSSQKRDFINYDYFSDLIKKVKSGADIKNNSLRQLLFTSSLELWYRMFIEDEKVESIKL